MSNCTHTHTGRHIHDGDVPAGDDQGRVGRRGFLKSGAVAAGLAAGAAAGVLGGAAGVAHADIADYADPTNPALPPSDVTASLENTALVVTDPQIDFLSPDGVTWGVVGESVTEHDTANNIGRLLSAAKARGMTVAISPHYYYPTDHG